MGEGWFVTLDLDEAWDRYFLAEDPRSTFAKGPEGDAEFQSFCNHVWQKNRELITYLKSLGWQPSEYIDNS